MRKSKLLLSLLFIPLFGLCSCNGSNNDPYKDKIVSDQITYTGNIKKEYNTGDSIDKGDVVVTINGVAANPVPYLDNDDANITKDYFFITTSNTAPTTYRIKKSSKLNTSQQTYSLNVYIACIRNSDDHVCVSKAIPITIKNSGALNPVLYYVGGAVIIVAVVSIVFFTRKYKQTH